MSREATLASIELDEGFSHAPYKDSLGLWTIGIGRCLETNPLTGAEWKRLLDAGQLAVTISLSGSRSLTASEYDAIVGELSSVLKGWPGFPEVVQDVLTEMAYQMGVEKLTKFRNMLAAAERHDWPMFAHEGRNSLWATQTPKR